MLGIFIQGQRPSIRATDPPLGSGIPPQGQGPWIKNWNPPSGPGTLNQGQGHFFMTRDHQSGPGTFNQGQESFFWPRLNEFGTGREAISPKRLSDIEKKIYHNMVQTPSLGAHSVHHQPLWGHCTSHNHILPNTYLGATGSVDHLTLLRLFLSGAILISCPFHLLLCFSTWNWR